MSVSVSPSHETTLQPLDAHTAARSYPSNLSVKSWMHETALALGAGVGGPGVDGGGW